MTNRIKEIVGGTKKDLYERFPWIKDANIENAVIDISCLDILWEGGLWKRGIWIDGISSANRCKWKVLRRNNYIKIGCNEKSIDEWEEWFSGNEEFETPRNTEAFQRIHNAFLLMKYEYELEKDEKNNLNPSSS